jgi:hypothetical protein
VKTRKQLSHWNGENSICLSIRCDLARRNVSLGHSCTRGAEKLEGMSYLILDGRLKFSAVHGRPFSTNVHLNPALAPAGVT